MPVTSINKPNDYGNTALQAAVHSNNYAQTLQILEQKGDPNITYKESAETALHRAILNQNPDIVKLLLQKKSSVNHVGRYGSAIHLAAIRDADILQQLLEVENADINIVNREGLSSLFVACMHLKKDNILLLLQHKADLSSKNASGDSVLHHSIRRNKFHVTTKLLQMGISANMQNDFTGNTILHEVKDNEVIQEFFRQNGNPNITNLQGNTALHNSMDCVWNVTKLLLDNNADINIRNNDNISPLLRAGIVSRNRLSEIVDYLKVDLISDGKGNLLAKELLEHPQVLQVNKDWIKKEQERQVENKAKSALIRPVVDEDVPPPDGDSPDDFPPPDGDEAPQQTEY